MIKALWLCNSVPRAFANRLNWNGNFGISWIDSMLDYFYKSSNMALYILFPVGNKESSIQDENYIYYPFYERTDIPYRYDIQLEQIFYQLLCKIQPDVVHIFGTEYAHTLAMMKAAYKASIEYKTIINIQGLCTYIARHYCAFLPYSIIHQYTIRDFIKKDNIYQQQKKFIKRGKLEVEALQLAKNVVGRTEWDKACIRAINPTANYYKCNEGLRNSFYHAQWDFNKCQKHAIFISQAYYPLKGFHILLEAVSGLLTKYADLQIYTTGISPLEKKWTKKDSYSKYLCRLIEKYKLREHITYLGILNEQQMCEQYLNAHVFISSSSIENSSNSLSEAMILGVPCIASDVGGTMSLFRHEIDGFLYQADAPYLLAYYIDKIFENENLAIEFSNNARRHALKTHDIRKIDETLLQLYEEVLD